MPKNSLTVTIVQSDVYWKDVDANLAMHEEKIKLRDTDLILFTEMFNTGFCMEAVELGESASIKTFDWMKKMANLMDAVIVGSYIVNEHSHFYNRLLWMRPDGSFDFYDKRHLFRMSKEYEIFSAGKKQLIVDIKSWKICPMICYDLRFPVWSRNINLQYDCLIFLASWPKKRINAWDVLLRARAIENSSYSIGINRIGKDGNGIYFNGHSAIYDPKGDSLFFNEGEEVIQDIQLDHEMLNNFREKFPAHRDADIFTLI